MINFGHIDHGIYVGSAPQNSADVARLKEMKVSAVISLQSDMDIKAHRIDWKKLQSAYEYNSIYFQRFPIVDFDEKELGRKLPNPARALDELRRLDHEVYVHCNAGICRAPATVLTYLCHFQDLGVEQGLDFIRQRRPQANPYISSVVLALAELSNDI